MADSREQSDDVQARLQDALNGVLLDKIRQDRFPSASVMDLVEQNLDERQLSAYGQALLDKITDERFPSHDMIKRLSELT
jgi:hypothetical protein